MPPVFRFFPAMVGDTKKNWRSTRATSYRRVRQSKETILVERATVFTEAVSSTTMEKNPSSFYDRIKKSQIYY